MGDAIAVIGDGAMSAGMAYEAMNNAGALGKRLFVILNDNEMSIAPPVGALSSYLSQLYAGEPFQEFRPPPRARSPAAGAVPRRGPSAPRTCSRAWRWAAPCSRSWAFPIIGPIDGHDLDQLAAGAAHGARARHGPVLLHVLTKKGKGYAPAEAAPRRGHATAKFDLATGAQKKAPSNAPSYTGVFAARCWRRRPTTRASAR